MSKRKGCEAGCKQKITVQLKVSKDTNIIKNRVAFSIFYIHPYINIKKLK